MGIFVLKNHSNEKTGSSIKVSKIKVKVLDDESHIFLIQYLAIQ